MVPHLQSLADADMWLYLSESEKFYDFGNKDALIWHEANIPFAVWGPSSSRSYSLKYIPSESVRNNESLYAHVFLARSGYSPDPSDPEYKPGFAFGMTHHIVIYSPKSKAGKRRSLLGSKEGGLVPEVLVTLFSAILMDKSGRRPLLMVSASGTCIGTRDIYGVGSITGTYWHAVFVGALSIGMGGVPWVIMSEIFPIKIKGIAGSLVTLVNWFGSWAISYAFNFLMSWSSAGTFLIFSAASATTIFFVARIVPETKGRTLEEIQESMNSERLR